ncbi:hypothetical protein TNCT_440231 [Trichonephila clavata]|uniref:Uncharacterized protein n=1 Tax=Trichonephila clavata TaxID=2740835 RepID=A0A8X6GGF4_TRICU|nr:hypothetical protein TNCT_440231 [Trichonephila clavata]
MGERKMANRINVFYVDIAKLTGASESEEDVSDYQNHIVLNNPCIEFGICIDLGTKAFASTLNVFASNTIKKSLAFSSTSLTTDSKTPEKIT